jgi:hypothetical protein
MKTTRVQLEFVANWSSAKVSWARKYISTNRYKARIPKENIYKYFTAHFTIVACRFQEVKRDIFSAPASSKISFISPKTKSIR